MTMNNMNMKYHNLKINTNVYDSGNKNKTPRNVNPTSSKSNYTSQNNTTNEINAINNRFSSLVISSPIERFKEETNKTNLRNNMKNERIEENKNSVLGSNYKNAIENKKAINLYDNSMLYNSEITPNFYNSFDPKTMRYSYKPYDSNKFKSRETPYNLLDGNNYTNKPDQYHSNYEEKTKSIKDNAKQDNYNSKVKKDPYGYNDNKIQNDAKNNFNLVDYDKNRDSINIMKLIGDQNFIPLSVKNLKLTFLNYNDSRYSTKSMPIIKAYAANTYQGIVRNYNEDRVSIILNIVKPSSFKGDVWPKCSFFGIYDGHGGASCADFLRDKLHQFIIKDPNFPSNITLAIKNAFEAADKEFLSNVALNRNGDVVDRSGSCAIIALIVDNICYTANVGDSRAILSAEGGKKIIQISNDHKPNEYLERKRIIDAGGSVYQTQTPARNMDIMYNNSPIQVLLGPYRVFPGRLSVSRAFGNVEAKINKFGGNANVLISTPEIKAFEITRDFDFLVIGCDGIYDQLSNADIINSVWMTTEDGYKSKNIHEQCGTAVDMIIKSALSRKSVDNVTCLIIAFENFERVVFMDNNYFSNNQKEIKPSIHSSMEYYKTSTTRKVSIDLVDDKGRPRTNSFISTYSSNNKNLTDNYNSEYQKISTKSCIKSTQSIYNNNPKKIILDKSPLNKRDEEDLNREKFETRNNGDTRLSFVEKYKISPFSTNEINTHYPSTTKNIDPKFKTYYCDNASNKIHNFRKGY